MRQKDSSYNGWTNYETWATALWVDNSEPNQLYWREVTAQCLQEAPAASEVKEGLWSVADAARFTLADRLKEEVMAASPDEGEATLYRDLLSAALGEINWHEIAESWLQELPS